MIWLWIAAGVVGFVVLTTLLGLCLPEKYAARVQGTLKRPPEEVWAALLDFHKHPMTGRMVKRIEVLPDAKGLPSWVEDMGHTRITVTTVQADAPTHLVRELKDQVVPMTARIEFHLERIDEGCRVTAVNEVYIRRGTWHVPIFRLIFTLTGALKKGVKDIFSGLARDFGDCVRFERG
jgi:hypothetical protein